MAEPNPVVVKYAGVDYPLVMELTEREKFDAERLAGRSLDDLHNYTAALILGFFTLRRAGAELTFDEFLDTSGFEFVEGEPPLSAAAVTGSESNGGGPIDPDGTPISAPSSESTPRI